MLMTNVDSDGSPSLHGIQCGMARISMVPSTGSPSQPRAQHVLQCAHRLVVAHVLVDGQDDAGRGAQIDAFPGLAIAHGQRLLGEDAADVAGVADGLADDGRLHVGRHGDVEHLDRRVGEQSARVA